MSSTVLFHHHPSDGWRASVARAIREASARFREGNPDAPGSGRSVAAADLLAGYVEGLPLIDPRFRQLLQASPDSDHYELTGSAPRFVQFLGLDAPAPADLSQNFSEFAAESISHLVAKADTDEVEQRVRSEFAASQTKDHARINELEAEIEKLTAKAGEKDQELSDLRGRLEQLDGGRQVDALSRQVAALEGEVDQANHRAAAAVRDKDLALDRVEHFLSGQKPAPKKPTKKIRRVEETV